MTARRSSSPGRSTVRSVLAAGLFAALPLMVQAPVSAQTGGECLDVPSDPGICLLDERFRVEVEWSNFSGNPFGPTILPEQGVGQGVHLDTPGVIEDSGYFYFLSPDDVELVVKILDGRNVNGHFWVVYGALTNVEYTIRVEDTATGRMQPYFNPAGTFGYGLDTGAFEGDEAPKARPVPPEERRARILPANGVPSCDDVGVACVQGDRFAIQAVWERPDQVLVDGEPLLTTSTSAFLSFPDRQSPDVLVKVVDGRDVNGSFWVFLGSIGPSPTDVTVTDRETGKATTYSVPEFEGIALGDRQPFAPDPPDGPWLETTELPGFRFKVRVTGGGSEIPTRQEADCIPETLCVSGAVPGRSELFLRIVGPKPNGFLQPNVVKFSTSQIEVWIEQLATEMVNYYELDGATPGSSDLTGFFDRFGFGPGQ